MQNLLFLDFETRSCADLKKVGADVYSKDPSTEVLCVGFAYKDFPAAVCNAYGASFDMDSVGQSFIINNHLLNKSTFVAHNAAFELAIWNNVCVPKYGWPPLKPEQVICTMAMAYAMALPGSLEKAAAAVGLEETKDMAGHRNMLTVSKPKDFNPDGSPIWWEDADKFQKLYAYCKQDVVVERKLYQRLMNLSDSEREIWQLDYEINQRGVMLDVPAIKTALKIVEEEKKFLDIEIRRITGNEVATCSSVAQLTKWVEDFGVIVNGVAKNDIVELLSEEHLPSVVREALLVRQKYAKSSTAKLQTMLDCVSSDGRVRGMFQYHGANTGRWAGRKIQLHNLPRPKMKQKDIDGVFELLK